MTLFLTSAVQMLVVSLFALVLVEGGKSPSNTDKNEWHDNANADTRLWCRSVQSTPEPNLVFYNRIPKCGSSTMQNLFQKIAHTKNVKHIRDVIAKNLPSPFWSPNPRPKLQQDIYEFVNSHLVSPDKTILVFNGHIGYFSFNTSLLRGGYSHQLEYTNVIRECERRQRSAFFFRLYDTPGALEAQKKNQTASFLRSVLKLDKLEDVSACLRNETCLRHAIKPDEKANFISTYMADCGHHGGCTAPWTSPNRKKTMMDEESEVASVLSHIKAYSDVYKTFGLVEYLSEYLEMLECVYPSMRGIVQAHSRSVSDHIHSQTFRHPDTTRINE